MLVLTYEPVEICQQNYKVVINQFFKYSDCKKRYLDLIDLFNVSFSIYINGINGFISYKFALKNASIILINGFLLIKVLSHSSNLVCLHYFFSGLIVAIYICLSLDISFLISIFVKIYILYSFAESIIFSITYY